MADNQSGIYFHEMRALSGDPEAAYAVARAWALAHRGKITTEDAPRSFGARIGKGSGGKAMADPDGRRLVAVELRPVEDTFLLRVTLSPPLFHQKEFGASAPVARHAAALLLRELWARLKGAGIECAPEPGGFVNWGEAFEVAGNQLNRGLLQYAIASVVSVGAGIASVISGTGLSSSMTALAGLLVGGLAWDGFYRILGGRLTRKVAREHMGAQPIPAVAPGRYRI